MGRHRRTPLELHCGFIGPQPIVSHLVRSDNVLVFFDPYHLRPAIDHLVALHRLQGTVYRVLAGCVGNQNDRHRRGLFRRAVRAFSVARNSTTGRPNGLARMPRATSAMSATTAEAVAAPPAPGPTSVIGGIPSPSMVTAFVTPITCAIDVDFGTMVGCTRCSMPLAVRTATPNSLTR